MEQLKLNQWTEYRFLSQLQAGSRPETAAFVAAQANADNGYDHHLWLMEQGRLRQLTAFNESMYIWDSADTLLFASLRDEKDRAALAEGQERTVFYRINIDQGEAQRAFAVPYTVTDLKKAGPNRYLMLIRYDMRFSNMAELPEAEKQALLKTKKEEQDYQVVSEAPYYFDGSGFTNGLRSRLALFDEVQGTVEFLTAPQFHVSRFDIDEKGQKAVYTGALFTVVKEVKEGVYWMDLDEKQPHCAVPPQTMQLSFALWCSDQILTAMSSGEVYGAGETPQLYLVDPDSGKQTLWNANQDTFGNAVSTDCSLGGGQLKKVVSGELLAVMTIADHTPLFRFDRQGQRQTALECEGAIQAFDLQGDHLYFIGMLDMRLQEIYEADLNTGEIRQCSHFNDEIKERCYIAEPKRIDFADEPDPLWGWVLEPKDYDPKKKYPAILDIHGGPRAAYGPVFYHEMQLWANEGYFVLFCNVHGSDGRGDGFADLRGKFGTIDFDDFMKFTDAVLDAYPQIDSNRVGVTGGSYGGYMTNWIIGHTDRFACAASQRSISNWVSENMVSDIGFSFSNDQMGATPWDNVSKIWDQSPLKAADQCTTPTLFIHSFEDYRCPIQEGMQMYNAIVHHGVEARMCLFKGESHGLSRGGRPLNRTRRLQEITEWMNRFCKGKEESYHE